MCYKNFGNNLKKLRKEVKITQEELGDKMGVSKTAIVNYENGNRKVPLEMVVKIANFFEIPIEYLLNKNPTEISLIREWYNEFKDVTFTEDEIDHLIHFANYLIYIRKDPDRDAKVIYKRSEQK